MSYFSQPLPSPEPGEEDAPYWQLLRDGALHFQQCEDCRRHTHPPALHCAHCGSPRRGWQRAPETGRIFSFTVIRRAAHPAVQSDLPYNVVLLEFDEFPGVRLVSNVLDIAPEDLRIGMAVTLAIERVGEWCLPRARGAT